MQISEGAPVVKWLQDLRLTTESECMSILQGKSVAKETLSIDTKVLHTKKLKGKLLESSLLKLQHALITRAIFCTITW